MPTQKAIHICNSHKPSLKPKIAKEYVLPALMKENSQHTTKAIRNLGNMLILRYLSLIKLVVN